MSVKTTFDIRYITKSDISIYIRFTPAVATIGTAPYNGLIQKLLWIFRCLCCPFTRLFYFCNIKSDPIAMCAYWFSTKHFVHAHGNNVQGNFQGDQIEYRPFGHYANG